MGSPRLSPVTQFDDHTKELLRAVLQGNFDEVPNSVGTLALRPPILIASIELWRAIMNEGLVPKGLKWMVGNLASKAHGCMYCAAHTVAGAGKHGISADKLKQLWVFETSDAFDAGEKSALRFAFLAAQSPNGVTEAEFTSLREHFTEPQIAELLAVVSVYGFFNRWNDSLAIPLEAGPIAAATTALSAQGWQVGRHG
jgi:alkylhydroperoxidase family enzyme